MKFFSGSLDSLFILLGIGLLIFCSLLRVVFRDSPSSKCCLWLLGWLAPYVGGGLRQGEFDTLQYRFPSRDGTAFLLGVQKCILHSWPHFELSYRYQQDSRKLSGWSHWKWEWRAGWIWKMFRNENGLHCIGCGGVWVLSGLMPRFVWVRWDLWYHFVWGGLLKNSRWPQLPWVVVCS